MDQILHVSCFLAFRLCFGWDYVENSSCCRCYTNLNRNACPALVQLWQKSGVPFNRQCVTLCINCIIGT